MNKSAKRNQKNAKKDDPGAANSSIPWVWLLKGGQGDQTHDQKKVSEKTMFGLEIIVEKLKTHHFIDTNILKNIRNL